MNLIRVPRRRVPQQIGRISFWARWSSVSVSYHLHHSQDTNFPLVNPMLFSAGHKPILRYIWLILLSEKSMINAESLRHVMVRKWLPSFILFFILPEFKGNHRANGCLCLNSDFLRMLQCITTSQQVHTNIVLKTFVSLLFWGEWIL